jgi:hypothetical protein
MEILGLSTLATVVLTGLVAGGTELVKRLFDADWRTVITIIVAALIGGFGGLVFGANFLVGMVFGLAASGYITIAQNVAKK